MSDPEVERFLQNATKLTKPLKAYTFRPYAFNRGHYYVDDAGNTVFSVGDRHHVHEASRPSLKAAVQLAIQEILAYEKSTFTGGMVTSTAYYDGNGTEPSVAYYVTYYSFS